MKSMKHNIFAASLLATAISLSACGGGTSTGPGPATNPGPNPDPADRFVISGNNDGTLSLMLVDAVAGFARSIGYKNLSEFPVVDMRFDAEHSRLVAITSNALHSISLDPDSGTWLESDSGATSGVFGRDDSSHLVLSEDGKIAYVASGASNGFIDVFNFNSDGTFGAATNVPVSVDPDYLALNPAGDKLYLVSRSDDQILTFDINPDGSLAPNPGSFNTSQNPTSLVFHPTADVAYLTRSDNNSSATLQLLIIDADGALAQSADFFDVGFNAIDMVLNMAGTELYVLDNTSSQLHHFSVDAVSGELSFVEGTRLAFSSAMDLTLSETGHQLYVGQTNGDVVTTLDVDPVDGRLSVVDHARIFEGSSSVVAIGGQGELQPTATFLMTPDTQGLSRFSIDANGILTLEETLNNSSALIDGEVAVEYSRGLLFATGETMSPIRDDLIASYNFDSVVGTTTPVQRHTANGFEPGIDSNSTFQRIEMGGAGKVMYVLDEDIFNSSAIPRPTGFIRAYSYDEFGNFSTTALDIQAVGEGPENMTLHPAGRYLYSVNSFGDNIHSILVNKRDGSISFGSTYFPASGILRQTPNRGRPIDLKFHPNGRFAYVSLEDDHQMVTYGVNDQGILLSPKRENPPQVGGQNVNPGPIAVHPSGRFVYVGERQNSNNIALYSVNPTDFSLTYQARSTLVDTPSWIEVDPKGEFLFVRERNDIEVFSINQATGALTNTGQSVVAGTGSGGFLPSMTLVSPLQLQ